MATTEGVVDLGAVEPSAPGCPVVGIGASAGGLAAFQAFFSGMPADDSGMAFVLVQHLAPDHKSILADLVKRYTRMEVFEVTHGMVVKPNCAYIIPPSRNMALVNGTLQLLEPETPRAAHPLTKEMTSRAGPGRPTAPERISKSCWRRRRAIAPSPFPTRLAFFGFDPIQRSAELSHDLVVILVQPLRAFHLCAKFFGERRRFFCGVGGDGLLKGQELVLGRRLFQTMTYHFTNSHDLS